MIFKILIFSVPVRTTTSIEVNRMQQY